MFEIDNLLTIYPLVESCGILFLSIFDDGVEESFAEHS